MSGAGAHAEGGMNGTYIGDTEMSSPVHRHTARLVDGAWQVSWLPGKILTRDQAITAMVVADLLARKGTALGGLSGNNLAALGNWGAELGLVISGVLNAWDDANRT